jgi:hypothetical protein
VIEVQGDFGKKAPVEIVLFLELYFGKVQVFFAVFSPGLKDAVDAKAGLFDFFGDKIVVFDLLWGLAY